MADTESGTPLPGRSRLPGTGTTIFAVMSAMARAHGALNLSQGFPDFAVPDGLRERVTEAMAAGHNQYAPMPGLPALTEAIAAQVEDLYAARVDPSDHVTITSGATEALFSSIQALVHPGDEVILFDPAYDSYVPAVRLAGGKPVHLPLDAPDFRPDFNRIADALGERTRMVIINTPHNPTGAVWTGEDMQSLGNLLANRDILVLSDEVYAPMVFDGARHHSVLEVPELRQRSVAVFSFGKVYNATGWKVGYAVAPRAISAEIRKIHQFVTFAVSTPMQHALADFMATSGYHRELADIFQACRDRFRNALAGSAWDVLPCSGTYFQMLGYGGVSDRPDRAMAEWLTTEVGVGAIPVSVFRADGRDDRVLRFCFAKDDATLNAAAEKLVALAP